MLLQIIASFQAYKQALKHQGEKAKKGSLSDIEKKLYESNKKLRCKRYHIYAAVAVWGFQEKKTVNESVTEIDELKLSLSKLETILSKINTAISLKEYLKMNK